MERSRESNGSSRNARGRKLFGMLIVVAALAAIGYLSFHYGRHGITESVVAGQRISNFMVERVNQNNVTGLLYMMYPLARLNGTPETLEIGGTVGYLCDGTLAKLVAIESGTALFILNGTASGHGCPV